MEWYEAEVAELVARLALQPVVAPAVFYGSSSITLWQSLARDLGNPRAENAGFGGSTLAACAHFFERIVPPLRPASLVIYAGDNDLGDGRSPDEVLASYERLCAEIDARCGAIPLGFISIKPSPSRRGIAERIRTTNALIRTALEQRPDAFYVDVFDAMLVDGEPRAELFLDDGLHMSQAGYDLWAQRLRPFHDRIFPP
jgi:lysophospholipase L1-like esterase